MGDVVFFQSRRALVFRPSPQAMAATLYPADLFLLVLSAVPFVTIVLCLMGILR